MKPPHLRVFTGETKLDQVDSDALLPETGAPKIRVPELRVTEFEIPDSSLPSSLSRSQVNVALGDLVPLLLDAALANRVWLEDFSDESVHVSQDLYEILLAYRDIAAETRRTTAEKLVGKERRAA